MTRHLLTGSPLRSALGRRILLVLMAVLTVFSLLFLGLFVTAYRDRLIAEHARASIQVNELLEASLKNAMLNRDIPGLKKILRELGTQSDIADVLIVNPEGEVRFSTDSAREGTAFDPSTSAGDLAKATVSWHLTKNESEQSVLRTINPVANETRCQQCHGEISNHPINGILVVDYRADEIKRASWLGALLMGLSGGAVLLAALGAIAIVLNRSVLRPVGLLDAATARFAEGDFAVRVSPQGDDELTRLASRFNDMAARLGSLVHRLRQSEDYLQKVIDAVPDGIRVISEDYTILKVNRAYCQQLGIKAEEALGTKCYRSSHHLDAPCSARLVTCPLEELKPGGRASLKCRHRHLTATNQELFVEVSAAITLLAQDGTPRPCIIESIRDLAEQAEVSHQHRLSEIGQIATGIAHEIHNPLSSIHLALSALREDLKNAGYDTGIDSYVDIADREINRCLEVTGRLLHISEPPSPEKSLLEIKTMISDVTRLVTFQASQSGATIEINIPGNPRIIANDSDLGILVLNVTQNAIHAMPKGGTLKITGSSSAGMINLEFADTGVGIPPENLHRIFWPFWSKRADGSMGSGLGLSICKATIERMGGTLRVESTLGVGTTFTISLPDADATGVQA